MITGPIVETSLARLPGYTRPEANDRLADLETARSVAETSHAAAAVEAL